MTSTQNITGLSKLDIKAMRQADEWISLRGSNRRTGTIVCSRKRKGDPYQTTDEYEMPCNVSLGGGARYGEIGERTSAHGAISSPGYGMGVWRTVCAFVRVGDILELRFSCGGGTNGYMDKAGLVSDLCYIVVSRKSERYQFLADSTTTTYDSSARMFSHLEPADVECAA